MALPWGVDATRRAYLLSCVSLRASEFICVFACVHMCAFPAFRSVRVSAQVCSSIFVYLLHFLRLEIEKLFCLVKRRVLPLLQKVLFSPSFKKTFVFWQEKGIFLNFSHKKTRASPRIFPTCASTFSTGQHT